MPTSGLDNLWTGHLADLSTHGLLNSRTGSASSLQLVQSAS